MNRVTGLLVTAMVWLAVAHGATAQDNRIDRFIPPNASVDPAYVVEGHILGGRTDSWAGAPDFLLRNSESHPTWVNHPLADGTPKIYAMGLVVGDIGDAPDLVIRRAGPDGAEYNDIPAPVEPGTSLGGVYWQAWGGRCEAGAFGFWTGCGGNGRTAQIYSRTDGEQTGSSRAGTLHLATTPRGNPGEPVDRLVITSDGRFVVHTPGGMREIEFGDPDSCGTGYRCLRIRN